MSTKLFYRFLEVYVYNKLYFINFKTKYGRRKIAKNILRITNSSS